MKLPVLLNEPPNFFDLNRVHQDLEEHKDLWVSVTYMHHHNGTFGDPDSQVKSTHYYLIPEPGKENQLIQLAVCWEPGKLEWAKASGRKVAGLPFQRVSNRPLKSLKVTWVV
jgi:hypothetical protein